MSEFDSLFDGLRGQRPPAPFASPEAVRRRGRARARRQAALTVVAVLALAGGGGAVTVTQLDAAPGPLSPAAAPPSLPTPIYTAVEEGPSPASTDGTGPDAASGVQRRWLLTPADLGPGFRAADHELLEGPWYWGECEHFPSSEAASLARRIGVDVVSFLNEEEPIPVRISQVVERYPSAEVAAENLSDVRSFLAACSRRPTPRDEVAPTYYEVISAGEWGDASLLLRITSYYFDERGEIVPYEHYDFVAVVVVRSVVSTVVTTDEELLLEVMPKVVDRLA